MLTMAAPSGPGVTQAAVTDGGGTADVRRASSRLARCGSPYRGFYWRHT